MIWGKLMKKFHGYVTEVIKEMICEGNIFSTDEVLEMIDQGKI
jgi:hypothetical protein